MSLRAANFKCLLPTVLTFRFWKKTLFVFWNGFGSCFYVTRSKDAIPSVRKYWISRVYYCLQVIFRQNVSLQICSEFDLMHHFRSCSQGMATECTDATFNSMSGLKSGRIQLYAFVKTPFFTRLTNFVFQNTWTRFFVVCFFSQKAFLV